MFDIDQEITLQIAKEGGDKYTNDPDDPGGPTKFGVTQAVARAYGYMGDMKDLEHSMAHRIYKERYWLNVKFDCVARSSVPLAAKLFEIGINMGQAVGVRFMQRALNVLNNEAKLFPDVAVDGGVGKMTLYSLDQFLKHRGVTGEKVLLGMVKSQQSVKYMEIAEGRPTSEKFEYGWQSNRV